MKDTNPRTRPHGKHLSSKPSTAMSVTRREVVKSAMVTAPVILTLRSGAAAAFASVDQCIAQNAKLAEDENPEPFLKENEPPDVWVRKETNCRKLKQIRHKSLLSRSDEEFWVYQNPDDPEQWLRMDSPTEKYQEAPLGFASSKTEDDDDRSEDRDRRPRMTLVGSNDLFKVKKENTCQILVLYDDYGNIAGYGAPSFANIGSPVTASCWASINPNQANLP